jgi:DNA-directed RNA polymerase subunit K/omega
LAATTGNIYEALAIISKRARQLAVDLKHELNTKLEEFAVQSDTIEEITENKEQIEISKFYERLPNPVIIATKEYLEGDLYYRYNEEKKLED